MEKLHSRRVGLALSGGGVRGIAHIGVVKALAELGIHPTVVAGTSAGSLVGAGVAAGMDWQALKQMAQSVFWPTLFHGELLERFCERHLPATFEQLRLPFAVVVTEFPARQAISLTTGRLASALSASCAIPIVRRSVGREGLKLKDGGYTCVLPATQCRELGAEFVISSDVWELSAMMRAVGCQSSHPFFPTHYREAVHQTDLLIQPAIPIWSYIPGLPAFERLIAEGELATKRALGLI